jgi:release factor glutamine methyltransferase
VAKLVARQHLLPSLSWLLEQVISSGRFSAVDLVIKDYSAVMQAFQIPSAVSLRRNASECFKVAGQGDLILLDEGGDLHCDLPMALANRSAGIEQTTSGMQSIWKCPIVLACRSAAKLVFESQIIARGVLRKLESLDLLDGRAVGVIGLGALGAEITRALLAREIPTSGTDLRDAPDDLTHLRVDADQLLHSAELILGCSGQDALNGRDLASLKGRKIFASCSSSDVEFRSVLKRLPATKRFEDVQGWLGELHCTVLNGGFPVNFDRVQEWELFEEILLTRMLVLEGLEQARLLIGSAPRGVMLNPATQLKIVNEWLEQVPDRKSIRLPEDLSEAYFRRHSEGEDQVNGRPVYSLHSTTPGALAKMRSHKAPYETDVLGVRILVLPNVWSPAYDWSSLFYVENLPQVNGLDFLEIGCGTGVVSVHAARAGVGRIVAVDVNPEAVRNTKLNFERFGVDNGDAFQSDGFSNVTGAFDVVTWNAPYHGARPADMLERGCTDEDYRDIRTFFHEVSSHLKPGGLVVFGFSQSGDLPLIERLIGESGFRVRRRLSDWRQDYNCILFDLVRVGPVGAEG